MVILLNGFGYVYLGCFSEWMFDCNWVDPYMGIRMVSLWCGFLNDHRSCATFWSSSCNLGDHISKSLGIFRFSDFWIWIFWKISSMGCALSSWTWFLKCLYRICFLGSLPLFCSSWEFDIWHLYHWSVLFSFHTPSLRVHLGCYLISIWYHLQKGQFCQCFLIRFCFII